MRRSLEQNLALIEELRGDGQKARPELAKMLKHKNNFLVARASEVAAEHGLEDLYPLIEEAFFRFMEDAVETDKTCRAKTAIVKSLVAVDRRAYEMYLAGIAHRQMEPVYGGREDTAVELRVLCADALVKFHHPDAVELLALLLADPEKGARAGAARSIGDTGRRDGVPLLKYKVTIGDQEPEVMTECFASLLRLGSDNVEFVRPFLYGDTMLAESAALAFGEARIEGSEPVLIAAAKDSMHKKVIFLALAMMRTKASIDHLLSVIEAGDDSAIEALEIYRHDTALMARIAEITSKRA